MKEGGPCSVQFELSLHQFGKFDFGLNPELNLGSVQLGSGSNFNSEPNFSNPTPACKVTKCEVAVAL